MLFNYHKPIVGSLFLAMLLLTAGCNSEDYNTTTGGNQSQIATFNSGNVASGESYSYTFGETGSVNYYCEIHSPDMQGQITVSSDAEAVTQDTVIMDNHQFQPSSLTIAPNTEVVWINDENEQHTVTSGEPSSGNNDNGGNGY